MISVLMPSRQRPELARQSIESLGDDIEVLIWVDDDDPELEGYQQLDAKVFIRPRVGYPMMHTMINYLAKESTGDWLLLWNDDALMHTSDWQDKLPTITHRYPQILNIFNSNPEVNLFPVINRCAYEIMGHYSLSAHCDSWVQDIANRLEIHTFVPGIEIEHIRDRLNDDTKNHSQGAYAITSPLHTSDKMQELMQKDIEKLTVLKEMA